MDRSDHLGTDPSRQRLCQEFILSLFWFRHDSATRLTSVRLNRREHPSDAYRYGTVELADQLGYFGHNPEHYSAM